MINRDRAIQTPPLSITGRRRPGRFLSAGKGSKEAPLQRLKPAARRRARAARTASVCVATPCRPFPAKGNNAPFLLLALTVSSQLGRGANAPPAFASRPAFLLCLLFLERREKVKPNAESGLKTK